MLVLEKKKDLLSHLSFLLKKHKEQIEQKEKNNKDKSEINEIGSPMLVLWKDTFKKPQFNQGRNKDTQHQYEEWEGGGYTTESVDTKRWQGDVMKNCVPINSTT